MPIHFFTLPYQVQMMVTEKLSMTGLAAFKEASQLANERSDRVCARSVQEIPPRVTEEVYFSFQNGELSFRFDFDEEYFEDYRTPFRRNQREQMKKMPQLAGLRFKAQKMCLTAELSEEFCSALAEYFEQSGSTIHELEVANMDQMVEITCEPPTFQKFLEASQVSFLNCELGNGDPEGALQKHSTQCEFIPDFKVYNILLQVESISGFYSQIEDEDLIGRNAENIMLEGTLVTSSGINSILKDWIEGKTKINRLSLDTFNRLSVRDVMRDIQFSLQRDHCIEIMNIHRQRMSVSIDKSSVNLITRRPNY